MKDAKLDFDLLVRAESIMAQEAEGRMQVSISAERREQIRDLIALSQAQSLKRIADALAGTADGQNSGILHAAFDFANHINRQ